MKRTWQLAASFDTAFAYRRGGTILDETVYSQHHVKRRSHYSWARDYFGFSKFRDGIPWSKIMTGSCQLDKARFEKELDYLAELSLVKGKPQIDLIVNHYGLPLISHEDVLNGRMADFLGNIAYEICRQWLGCFSGYVTSVENGYATAMQTHLGQWQYSADSEEKPVGWWELFEARMRASITMSKVFKQNDPNTPRVACEPFYKSDAKFKDQLRPLRCILGSHDRMARRDSPSQTDMWGGDPSLLTDIGLNYYGNQDDDFEQPQYPLSWLLVRAKKRFPNYNLRIAETGNCQVAGMGIDISRWLQMVDEQVTEANAQGAGVTTVTWAPFLPIEDFSQPGVKSPGSLVDGPELEEDSKQLAKIVREYT